jgi:hypothetical protein
VTEEPARFVPMAPAADQAHESSPSFEWVDGAGVAIRADEIAAALVEDGADAEVTEFVAGVRFVDVRWHDPAAREMIFVHAEPWSGGVVAAILRDHYAIRASEGPHVSVSFVGPHAPPFSLEYLYGDHWWGPLEAELYRAFANPELDPLVPGPFVDAAAEVLEQFGISLRGDRFATLDDLLAALPRPTDLGTTYQPVATLVAIGLTMGDGLETRHSRVEWAPGEELMARYFGLRIAGEDLLRPIDFVMEAYRAPLLAPIQGYAELVSLRASIE